MTIIIFIILIIITIITVNIIINIAITDIIPIIDIHKSPVSAIMK